jgi:hypothetical protein
MEEGEEDRALVESQGNAHKQRYDTPGEQRIAKREIVAILPLHTSADSRDTPKIYDLVGFGEGVPVGLVRTVEEWHSINDASLFLKMRGAR